MAEEVEPGPAGSGACALCRAPAPRRCAGCRQVAYCGREHQKLDWKQHRGQCRPFKVCCDPELGRHLVATRDVRAGELLLREAPLLAGPAQRSPPVCVGCLEPLGPGPAPAPCERCGWPLCSPQCPRKERHQPECDVTAEWRGQAVRVSLAGDPSAPHPMYQCVLPLRLLWTRERAPARWAKLWALESHCELRRRQPRWEQDRAQVAQFVRSFFGAEQRFTEDELMRVCGILQVNGHEVPLTEPPHVAVYEAASLLEHSCRPNLSKSFGSDGELLLRAAEPVARGQHLSICYTDALWGTANRRHHLSETKFFWCRCARCRDPTEGGTFFSALRCPTEGCGGLVAPLRPVAAPGSSPEEEEDLDHMRWTCRECTRLLDSQHVFRVLEKVGSDLAALRKGDPADCARFLERWGGPAGPLADDHFYLTDARLALAQLHGQGPGGLAAASDAELADKRALCRRLLRLTDSLVPAEHRVRGLLRFELHAALAEEARRRGLAGADEQAALRAQLLESRAQLEQALALLKHEPPELPEGQLALQAARNLADLQTLLRGLHVALGGDCPM